MDLRNTKEVNVVEQDVVFSVLSSKYNHILGVLLARLRLLLRVLVFISHSLIDVGQAQVIFEKMVLFSSGRLVHHSRVTISFRWAKAVLITQVKPLARLSSRQWHLLYNIKNVHKQVNYPAKIMELKFISLSHCSQPPDFRSESEASGSS